MGNTNIYSNIDFDFKRVAQGYKERPFLHKQVIERFQRDVTKELFLNGLDVGCGAGLSSMALKQICGHVTGTDISPEMIAVAREVCKDSQGYDFFVSSAEKVPSAKEKYDIVTAAGVIQWINRESFLKNLRNIIKGQGYVLIYDFCVSDKMRDSKTYSDWWHNAYLKEFPKPFRNESVWSADDVNCCQFSMIDQVQYEMEYQFDKESFIKFMMIQSNVNAKIEGEGRNIEDVRRWFEQSLAAVFDIERRTVIFTGYSWYMKALYIDGN
ncbi:MAG: methyltransferase domain-containing protein [Lachnospiraceae bacterium]|nr:methyltransferase domain-containing protein [Lachnospiraceae bacterium]